MLRNLNYIRSPNVIITLLSLRKICYVNMPNINVKKFIIFFDKVSSSKCTKCTIARGSKPDHEGFRDFLYRLVSLLVRGVL